MIQRTEVIIIGAGLAGLCCARRLAESGVAIRVLEATGGVGGRVRTETVDGFRLDRGFQVLLTSLPEVRRVLDLQALDVRPFRSAAMVRTGNAWHRVACPWHEPVLALRSLRNPAGTSMDKLRAGLWSLRVNAGTLAAIARRRELPAEAYLKRRFSPAMIERFFRPFFGGVFLDRNLDVSSRWLEWMCRMFATGQAVVPARGMGEIPKQLAGALPGASLRLRSRVTRITGRRIRMDDGAEWEARAIVVATEGPEAEKLIRLDEPPGAWREMRTWWFSAVVPPHAEPWIYLNGTGAGPVNSAAVLSNASRDYAPRGRALINVTTLPGADGWDCESAVRTQLREWFGPISADWKLLRAELIRHALPAAAQTAPHFEPRPAKLAPGLFICGDHRATASIDGAMLSGRRAAEAVLAEFAANPVQGEML